MPRRRPEQLPRRGRRGARLPLRGRWSGSSVLLTAVRGTAGGGAQGGEVFVEAPHEAAQLTGEGGDLGGRPIGGGPGPDGFAPLAHLLEDRLARGGGGPVGGPAGGGVGGPGDAARGGQQ